MSCIFSFRKSFCFISFLFEEVSLEADSQIEDLLSVVVHVLRFVDCIDDGIVIHSVCSIFLAGCCFGCIVFVFSAGACRSLRKASSLRSLMTSAVQFWHSWVGMPLAP